ncbi:SDR family oxidoreductase [Pseudomonas soli]|uniref:SDR family oxidoreductase n=1 Tax=Pseudomonas soli TaxID=1306993 RepID=A0A1H9FS29_9PSED|nr:SDR family oxidoreductase [Pseudomonas soli]MDT3716129.1 SDR family oxidoreductase [Pseudomonas soli]MDT3732787.1 SDR family oxidoreductase [Pseudomonas soli]MEE1881901.1 SDR family oxidoreductase [Pseudomonas soli]NBK41166.1 SDR family oxidoreductase [Pseudomonas soli]WJO23586.1 SDR family oxidoreductase [Pseudomonas soli]
MTAGTVFLTGASGFVGQALLRRLLDDGVAVTAAVRDGGTVTDPRADRFVFASLTDDSDWQAGLAGREVLIHAAARVHVMNDREADPLAAFRRVNVDGTLALAHAAVAAGVKRFIFISSIKVNGESTSNRGPYCADDVPAPRDPYGISKLEAEQALLALGRESGLEIVIIRPVLVYGPGVKANFRAMMRWVNRGLPLPLGLIDNRRSLVALDNLVDLIATCRLHPAAAGEVFLVSDGEDLSTSALLRRMAAALGKPSRLLPVPVACLRLGASLLGKRGVAERLCGSLQVDIDKTLDLLDWTPPLAVDEALKVTARQLQDGSR